MSQLSPVKPDYVPGYPRTLTAQEIHELLRPSLFKRFSSKTLLVGAVLLTGCGVSQKPPVTTPPPTPGVPPPTDPAPTATDAPRVSRAPLAPLAAHPTTHSDAAFKAKVDQLVTEVLGAAGKSNWGGETTINLHRELAINPPVKYPHIPISYGNSYVGIFDTEAARAATIKLFALYGIELKAGVSVEGAGYKFQADGFDEKTGTGFKMVLPEGAQSRRGIKIQDQPSDQALEPAEFKPLEEAEKAGQIRIFVADASAYPNMDGDLYTPMQYYLASVVDYLNWIHGDTQIELSSVLGSTPGGRAKRSWRSVPALPGGDVETDADVAYWKVSDGSIALSTKWAGFGSHSLEVKLNPGGSLLYTAPAGNSIVVDTDRNLFGCQVYFDELDKAPMTLNFELNGDGGKQARVSEVINGAGNRALFKSVPELAQFKELKSVKITTDRAQPLTFYIDDLGVSQIEKKADKP